MGLKGRLACWTTTYGGVVRAGFSRVSLHRLPLIAGFFCFNIFHTSLTLILVCTIHHLIISRRTVPMKASLNDLLSSIGSMMVRDLLSVIGRKYDQYLDFRQQDAHEFLRHMLDAMRMEEFDVRPLLTSVTPAIPDTSHLPITDNQKKTASAAQIQKGKAEVLPDR